TTGAGVFLWYELGTPSRYVRGCCPAVNVSGTSPGGFRSVAVTAGSLPQPPLARAGDVVVVVDFGRTVPFDEDEPPLNTTVRPGAAEGPFSSLRMGLMGAG